MRKYKTLSGKEHGLIGSMPNSSKTETLDPKIKEEREKKLKENVKIKKAQYLHKDGEGNYLSKTFCLGAGHPLEKYLFLHGYEYEVPYGLIEDVNAIKNVQRSEVLDKNGAPTSKDKEGDKVHRFIPVSF